MLNNVTQQLGMVVKVDGVQQAKGQMNKLGASIKSIATSLGLVVGASAAMRMAFRTFGESIELARTQEIAIRKVGVALENAGYSAAEASPHFEKIASELQKISNFGDEDILVGVTAELLRFGAVAGDEFERAQKLSLDLAAAMGGEGTSGLSNAARQVGMALADPVLGLTRLRRAGIMFTKDQEQLIRSLVETGKQAEAQNVILTAMEQKYGGIAQASVNTATQLKNSWGDYLETLGAATLPIYDGISMAFNQMLITMAGNLDEYNKTMQEQQAEQFRYWNDFTTSFILNTNATMDILFGTTFTAVKLMLDSFISTATIVKNTFDVIFNIANRVGKYVGSVFGDVTTIISAFDSFDGLLSDINNESQDSINSFAGVIKNFNSGMADATEGLRNYKKNWYAATDAAMMSYQAQQNIAQNLKNVDFEGIDFNIDVDNADADAAIAKINDVYATIMRLNASAEEDINRRYDEMLSDLIAYLDETVTNEAEYARMKRDATIEIEIARQAELDKLRENEQEKIRAAYESQLDMRAKMLADLAGYESQYHDVRIQQIEAEAEKMREAGMIEIEIAAWVAAEKKKLIEAEAKETDAVLERIQAGA